MLPILIIRNFNPRAPYGARPRKQRLINAFTNFNPRAPYGARLDPKYIKDMYHAISIHAPHTGRDGEPKGDALDLYPLISIHAPHTGRDRCRARSSCARRYFNPRAPYGARPSGGSTTPPESYFNPRAPYGARRSATKASYTPTNFNPRAPYGARPGRCSHDPAPRQISIHAPHTGRDSSFLVLGCWFMHFNPRAPYGARLPYKVPVVAGFVFQSTRPIRGATLQARHRRGKRAISIHAPHTGRDPLYVGDLPHAAYFNPRAPYGARRSLLLLAGSIASFQSTRPIRGATYMTRSSTSSQRDFNPRAPYGARRKHSVRLMDTRTFQSTRPIRGATAGLRRQSGRLPISIHAPHTGRDSKNA